jgi:ADP-ribosylglycohydrolase
MADRKTAALLGAFVGDAATMPLHWIYNNADLKALVADATDPLFFSTPSCPFYNSRSADDEGNAGKGFPGHYEVGQLSPYGEQALACLAYLEEHKNAGGGPIDGDAWAAAFHAWAKSYTGRPDHAVKVFVDNVDAGKKYPETGADDNQSQSFAKVVCVLYTHEKSGDNDDSNDEERLLANVEVCVRAHQNNDLNVAVASFWARLLRRVVAGQSVQAAFEAAKASAAHEQLLAAIARVEANLASPTFGMLMEYGQELHAQSGGKVPPIAGLSCANPGATMAALHVVLKAESFAGGLTTNALLGGDSCARSNIIGAVLGAVFGVPQEYAAKLRVPELAKYGGGGAAEAGGGEAAAAPSSPAL